MGKLGRIGLVGIIALSFWGGGCSSRSDDKAAKRREILKGPDLRAIREERQKKTRFMDDEGELIPSDTKVAGVQLPRGLELRIQYEDHWYFESLLPLDKLQRYFGRQLDTVQIERGNEDSVTFRRARPKGEKVGPMLTVRVGRMANLPSRSEVRIDRTKPDLVKNRPKTFPQAEAELRKRRKYAD